MKAEKAKEILDSNYIMINSLLTKEEKKSFKDYDFVKYLKYLCDKEILRIKGTKN